MDSKTQRIYLAGALAFVIGMAVEIFNGRNIVEAFFPAIFFSILVEVIIAVLVWIYGYSERKGYSGWLGIVLVFFFNFPGLLVMLLLPRHRSGG